MDGVGAFHRDRHPGGLPPRSVRGGRPLQDPGHRGLLAVQRHRPAARPAQHQQVLGQAHDAIRFGQCVLERPLQFLRGPRPGQRQLELHLQHAERRPELVAGPVQEPLFLLHGLLQPSQHRVQRAAEPSELVPGLGNGEPRRGFRERDGRSFPPHPLHGAEGRPGHDPTAPRHQSQRDGTPHRERQGQAGQRFVPVTQRCPDHDVHAARTASPRHRQDPGRVVHAVHVRGEEGGTSGGAQITSGQHRGARHCRAGVEDRPARPQDLGEGLVGIDQMSRRADQPRGPVRDAVHDDLRPRPQFHVDAVHQVVAHADVQEQPQRGQDDRHSHGERERHAQPQGEPHASRAP